MLQLPFEPFVAIETQFGIIGKVAAEFEEEGPEVAIHTVDVEVVDHRRGARQPRIGGPGLAVASPFRAEDPALLLGLADEQNSFFALELLQVFDGNVVLPLAFTELHHWNRLLPGKTIQSRHNFLADRVHQRTRGKKMSTMEPEEGGDATFALKRNRHEPRT